VAEAFTERNRAARELFAPIAETYDRYARLLSFGQDGRWRAFLVSRLEASAGDTIADVACGTGSVAVEIVRRYGCTVVGVDQSAEMLAAGSRRVAAAGLADRISLLEARAEELPFAAASFEGLTFTYLLRYVDDPAATLRELARVVRPGGRIASLEFHLPRNPASRLAWEAYTRIGLPVLGRAASRGWGDVGRFLGPSIRDFYGRYPLERQLELWRAAGIERVQARVMSLGGGVVIWGTRGD
jgi:demethylmenaquinone methyltransferase/2-methoxy-6-polyprenyl-1,4-benzoquinol methylase